MFSVDRQIININILQEQVLFGRFVVRCTNPFQVIQRRIKFQIIQFRVRIVLVYRQLNDKTVLFQAIQFKQSSSIWSRDRTLSGATTPGLGGPGSDGNEWGLCVPQSSSITGTSPSVCSYPTAEVLSMYSIAPADCAIHRVNTKLVLFQIIPFRISLDVKAVLFRAIEFTISTQFKCRNRSILTNSV